MKTAIFQLDYGIIAVGENLNSAIENWKLEDDEYTGEMPEKYVGGGNVGDIYYAAIDDKLHADVMNSGDPDFTIDDDHGAFYLTRA